SAWARQFLPPGTRRLATATAQAMRAAGKRGYFTAWLSRAATRRTKAEGSSRRLTRAAKTNSPAAASNCRSVRGSASSLRSVHITHGNQPLGGDAGEQVEQ